MVIEKRRTTGADARRQQTTAPPATMHKVTPTFATLHGLLHADYRSPLLGDDAPNDRTACTTV